MPEHAALPTLKVGCIQGLGNRMRVLLSGMAWERLGYRRFTMIWHPRPACAALFSELFEPDPHIHETTDPREVELPYFGGYLTPPMFDIAASREPELAFCCATWLTPPRLKPWKAFACRFLPRAPGPFTPVHRDVLNQTRLLFDQLKPIPVLRARIDEFRARYFRPRMIGVHVRRGDFTRTRADLVVSLSEFLRATERYLRSAPDAGIFLATDDGGIDPLTKQPTPGLGIHALFRERFGDRVVMAPTSSLDRGRPEAIQDALVELYLLRSTDFFVGTEASSFSELAVWGRETPHVVCAGRDPKRWLWRLTLIEPIVLAMGLIEFRRMPPFYVLRNYYGKRLRSLWS